MSKARLSAVNHKRGRTFRSSLQMEQTVRFAPISVTTARRGHAQEQTLGMVQNSIAHRLEISEFFSSLLEPLASGQHRRVPPGVRLVGLEPQW